MSQIKRRNPRKPYADRTKLWRKANAPSDDFMFIDLALLQSPPWQVAPPEVKLVVLRLVQEHHEHGGNENGDLIVTYDQFEAYGISRRRIKWAIDAAKALGFIKHQRGAAYGEISRASRYLLTFRPSAVDDGLPTNEWKAIRSLQEAWDKLPDRTKCAPPATKQEKRRLQPDIIPVAG